MSNHLAIATVTASLCQLLQEAVDADTPVVSGAKVDHIRPNELQPGNQAPGVNVFLYQASPNAAWRNTDLPSRRVNGTEIVQRPRVALDLQYLLTFHGNEKELEPQRLLGSVARVLHTKPVLDRSRVRTLVTTPSFSFLSGSNLAEDVESVRFTPTSLSLDELSKLWSVVFQTPYFLSAAYQAGVVLIESDDAPQSPLPVRERRVFLIALRQPIIDEVAALDSGGKSIPIVAGGTLTIRGNQLRGDTTEVMLGGKTLVPASITPTRVEVPLPAADVRAGVQGVQVIHSVLMGKEPPPPMKAHRVVESNVAAFVLQPTIVPGTVTNTDVALAVQPAIRAGQRVTLLLNKQNADPPIAYSFSPPTLPEADTNAITIAVKDVESGDYFVRLRVDGAESPLDFDTASPTFGPTVTIP